MKDESKFRTIPRLDTFKIPFKLEEQALTNWLIDLNQSDGKSACLQTLSLLQVLNKTELSFKNRLTFLNLINEYLQYYIRYLEGECWDAGFPLSIEENVYAEIISWNYLTLAQGYFMVAEQISKKNELIFVLAMALESLGQAQLHIAATYSCPNDGFWRLNYQIFALAEKRKLQHQPIENNNFNQITLNTLFSRSLIFYVCDTNQFYPRDMRTIFNFLPKVCHALSVSIYSQGQDLFMLDLKTDTPPYHVKAQVELGSDLVRYFSPVIIADVIDRMIHYGNVWTGALKSINNTLFSRVVKTLQLKQTRQHTRKKEKHNLLGVIGFENIIGFLYKVSKNKINEAQHTKEETNFDSEHQELSIWEKNKIALTESIKKVSLNEIKVYDSSTIGYALSWSHPPINGKVGDLIGIVSADKKRLEVAILRRVVSGSDDIIRRMGLSIGYDFESDFGGDFKFGVEILAFQTELVYLSSIKNRNVGAWAIFLPENEVLGRTDTLIYRIGQFKTGENVYLHRGNQTILCLLMKELHSTVTISHVELAYPPPN